jgi:cytochrome c5
MIRLKQHWINVSGLVLAAGLMSGCGEPAATSHPGEETYNRFCFSCHQGGIAGAPKFGDAQQWAPRIAQGMDVLLANTKKGINPGMPAMGLCNSCTEQDLIDVIDYMVKATEAPAP